LGGLNSPNASGSPATKFTAADIQMSFPLEAAAARAGLEQGTSEGDGVPRAHPCAARPISARWKRADRIK